MFCEKCGNQVPDNAQFCGKCGAAMTPGAGTTVAGQKVPKETKGGKGKGKFPVWAIGVAAVAVIAIVVGIVLLVSDSDGYTYKIDGKTVVITGFKGNPVDLVIPQEIMGKPVMYIETNAFAGCASLRYITIPDSVTTIGQYAFCDCTGLQSITIPDSVSYIGDHAFAGCTNLESISIPNGLTGINDHTFSGCTSLKSIYIPSSVTSIPWRAFLGSTLQYIYGESGSYAQQYADENGYYFVNSQLPE